MGPQIAANPVRKFGGIVIDTAGWVNVGIDHDTRQVRAQHDPALA